MTTNIKSVQLSHDFVITQHFRLCKLFSKQVCRYFLHQYVTGSNEKRYVYTMSMTIPIVRVKISTW